jgi:CheY-like chemotaxis protein
MSPNPPTVLIVDDNDFQRKLTRMVLMKQGYQILDANSGQAGLEILSSSPVDIIVCDMCMPAMNGLQFATEVRSHEELAPVPIIILTAETDEINHAAASAVPDAVCDKLNLMSKLVGQVEQLLKSSHDRAS